ncbi:cytochrome c [Nitrosomonas sp. Nm34]|uniref:c-type cytochrome n=1 Tax=Nitrosomonas sp. Nm34 TaxID=1881055 RepID=UPI0008E831FC|nr:cytochrome c [Nitrosomonas sp. Nm34]SFI24569.1 Cytochrome c [Nitrosomonas sp. Nm34]
MRNLCYCGFMLVVVYVVMGLTNLAFARGSAINTKIEFKNKGEIVRILHLEEFAAIASERFLKIYEPHEKRIRTYQVYSARSLFDHIFGKNWREAEEIVFLCADGYQPSIPVAKFLAYDAYFAFASADDSPFTLENVLQNNETVKLEPLYLVWDSLKSTELREEGAADMPYQIKEIELASFATRFPALFPPANASQQVQQGFLHFRKHCIACHTINGQGGGKAPELNYPLSVTEYIQPEYLKRWIDNPSSIRYNTTMPPLTAEIPAREKVIEELIAYLKAISTVKRIPGAIP